jgi:hypothetical protein
MPQNSIKKSFRVVSYYFSYKNRPNDLVKGLFLCLDPGTYILPTCGLLHTFLGPFGGAYMPQGGIEIFFSICPGLFLPQARA